MYRIALNLIIVGHLLGDFYFQSSSLASSKKESFSKLIIHCVIYFISMTLLSLPIINIQIFVSICIISSIHLLIDFSKFMLDKHGVLRRVNNETLVYCLDQFLHICTILLVLGIMFLYNIQIYYVSFVSEIITRFSIDAVSYTSWLLMILIILKPISVTLKVILNKYQPKNEKINDGVPNAGSFIGKLERSIILMLLFAGEFGAIGFVLTAKSIARYKKISDHIDFSEYYLLGTLLSTALVIFFLLSNYSDNFIVF